MSTKEYHQDWYLKNKERIAAKSAAYYTANREKVRQLQKAAYKRRCEKDPTYHTRMLERSKQSYQRRIDAARDWAKSNWARKRIEVMTFVGGDYGLQCRRCGFDEFPALQIDHVHGGGRAEIRLFKDSRKYLDHIKKSPQNYQILCANCNWLKKHEKNEVPRKKDATPSPIQNPNSQIETDLVVPLQSDNHKATW